MSKLSQLKQDAYQAGKKRNWDEAVALYERILEADKNNPTVINELGDLCLKAGKTPDPALGKAAKQRSLHNNYLTLPVIFLMLSNHYPLAFATPYNWAIASLVFIMGVLIRHYFNTKHARKGRPNWTWLLTAIVFIIIIWLSTNPFRFTAEEDEIASPHTEQMMARAGFDEARDVVISRCSMCHAAEPVWDGVRWPPKGVRLDTDIQIAEHARQIYLQAGVSHAMPPGNITEIPDEERAALVRWYTGKAGS